MAQSYGSEEFPVDANPFEEIIEVGWGGRFGFVNITPTKVEGSRSDFRDTLITAYAFPPHVGSQQRHTFAVDAEIPRDIWKDSAHAVKSITFSGAMFPGQIINFKILETTGNKPVEGPAQGDVIVDGWNKPRYVTFEAELVIYSSGKLRVKGLNGGEHPDYFVHFKLDEGATIHFTGKKSFRSVPNFVIGFAPFDKNGYIGMT